MVYPHAGDPAVTKCHITESLGRGFCGPLWDLREARGPTVSRCASLGIPTSRNAFAGAAAIARNPKFGPMPTLPRHYTARESWLKPGLRCRLPMGVAPARHCDSTYWVMRNFPQQKGFGSVVEFHWIRGSYPGSITASNLPTAAKAGVTYKPFGPWSQGKRGRAHNACDPDFQKHGETKFPGGCHQSSTPRNDGRQPN